MRFVSTEVNEIIHYAIIDTLDTDMLEADVSKRSLRLPVRLLCEMHKHGCPSYGSAAVRDRDCSRCEATCTQCVFLCKVYNFAANRREP